MMTDLTKTKKSVAVVNGTSALQVALRLSGVGVGDEVLTQALTFIATINAIVYNGASPVFLDVDLDTMGLSPSAVNSFLEEFGELRNGICYNKRTNKKIAACMPMHTFGFPVHLEELITICTKWNIPIVEDAAESIGSEYKGMPTGSFGKIAVFSFNGNKVVTSGGGGAIVTNDLELGAKAKHLTTTAKVPHPYEYVHDEIGYNLKPMELQASIGLAQMTKLPEIHALRKRNHALLCQAFSQYEDYFIIPKATALADPSWFAFAVTIKNGAPFKRKHIVQHFENAKIQTRPYFAGNIMLQPAYLGIMSSKDVIEKFPIARKITTDTFFLGTSPVITEEQICYIKKNLDLFITSL